MSALRVFVFRHDIFVEAREFDDGLIFVRQPKGRAKRFGPRRHFEVFLRRDRRRTRFCTLTCGSDDHERSQITIDFPETALLRPAEAAIEYEACGRDAKRYSERFPKDADAGRALFGYVRSESRLLERLLDGPLYRELLRLVRRHRHKVRPRTRNVSLNVKQPRPRS
ncbi:MAG TPA: hypothetical protein VI485_12205 [Vicinamibacterales bacterium]|nr:hypothetical protein [Vicinamibacterales bacterium]